MTFVGEHLFLGKELVIPDTLENILVEWRGAFRRGTANATQIAILFREALSRGVYVHGLPFFAKRPFFSPQE